MANNHRRINKIGDRQVQIMVVAAAAQTFFLPTMSFQMLRWARDRWNKEIHLISVLKCRN